MYTFLVFLVSNSVAQSRAHGQNKGPECVTECLKNFTHNVKHELWSQDNTIEEFWQDLFNAGSVDGGNLRHSKGGLRHGQREAFHKFKIVCNEVQKMEACVKAHCYKQYPKLINGKWSTLNYVCVKKRIKFEQHFKCIHRHEKTSQASCKKTRPPMESTTLNQLITAASTDKELISNLAEYCSRFKGYSICFVKRIRSECNKEASYLMEMTSRLQFRMFYKTFAEMGTGKAFLPNSCTSPLVFNWSEFRAGGRKGNEGLVSGQNSQNHYSVFPSQHYQPEYKEPKYEGRLFAPNSPLPSSQKGAVAPVDRLNRSNRKNGASGGAVLSIRLFGQLWFLSLTHDWLILILSFCSMFPHV